ncbi:MAG: trehalose-phosphatase, partial [Steroidobacteraceae bacterium]
FGGDPRLLIEDKGAGVALHYRRAPERAGECIAAMRELAAAAGLAVITGKNIVEARPRGTDKGVAVELLAVHAPFSARPPVFVGDDVTDEDGFRAAERAGGHGVKVGPGATAARYRLDRVGEVHDWLDSSLTALEQEDCA